MPRRSVESTLKGKSEVWQLTDASDRVRWMGGQGDPASELISMPDKLNIEEEPHLMWQRAGPIGRAQRFVLGSSVESQALEPVERRQTHPSGSSG